MGYVSAVLLALATNVVLVLPEVCGGLICFYDNTFSNFDLSRCILEKGSHALSQSLG